MKFIKQIWLKFFSPKKAFKITLAWRDIDHPHDEPAVQVYCSNSSQTPRIGKRAWGTSMVLIQADVIRL